MTGAHMQRRSAGALAAAGTVGLLLTSCVVEPADDWVRPIPAVEVASGDLPTAPTTSAVPKRLADDVSVPTSRWYSSIVFADELQPVYPFPLAVAPRDDGFSVALAPVVSTPDTIAAPFVAGVSVDLGTDQVLVVDADPVAVTVEYRTQGEPVARVTLAEGSPVVGLIAHTDVDLRLESTPGRAADGVWTMTSAGTDYVFVAPNAQSDGATLRLAPGDTAQLFPLPTDGDLRTWVAALGDPVTGVEVGFRVTAGTAATRLTYRGTDSTVLVPFAGHEVTVPCELGSYETAYGVVPACAATSLEWSVPAVAPATGYDLDGLDAGERDRLLGLVRADLEATATPPADTYFGGKALARLAAMLELARSLGDDDLAAAVADTLRTHLSPWLDLDACAARQERCFVFDDRLNLVVGQSASFGSEEGNDHHFHYGYFLAAGAALAAERPEDAARLSPVLDRLAADIAAGSADQPALRVFDPYRGHSWAAGLGVFADGNNQESSSEAVAAWNALAAWAAVSGNEQMATLAGWMLSAEADAATRLWLDPDLTSVPDGYRHSIVSLTWGGKRDYATWFSPEPSAILGIQLLPLTAASLRYLPSAPERVAELVAEAGGVAGFDGALGDYVLLYSALAGPDALVDAERLARARTEWDDGLSPSAAAAWLAAVRLHSER